MYKRQAVYRVRTNGASAVVETASSNDIIEFGEVSANPDASKIYAYAASGTLKMIVIYEL